MDEFKTPEKAEEELGPQEEIGPLKPFIVFDEIDSEEEAVDEPKLLHSEGISDGIASESSQEETYENKPESEDCGEAPDILVTEADAEITPVRPEERGTWLENETPQGQHLTLVWNPNAKESEAEKSRSSVAAKSVRKKLWAEKEEVDHTASPGGELNQTFCPYCGTQQNRNFVRHLIDNHCDERVVKTLIKVKDKKCSRKETMKITKSLRKLGRYKFMEKHGDKFSIPCKKTKPNAAKVVCKFCLGMYSYTNFSHHFARCPMYPKNIGSTQSLQSDQVKEIADLQSTSKSSTAPLKLQKIAELQTTRDSQTSEPPPTSDISPLTLKTSTESLNTKKAKTTIPPLKSKKTTKQFTTVIPSTNFVDDQKLVKAQQLIYKTIQMTDAGKQALNDPLIVKFAAERLPGSQHDLGKLDYLRQGVRDLSKLLSEMKGLDTSIKQLSDCFVCTKFETLMQAVYNISETDYLNSTVKKTSFNLRLRNPIGLCVELLMSEVRRSLTGQNRDEKISDLRYFKEELESRWARNFGKLTARQVKENRHGKVITCTDPEDMKNVFQYCHEQLPEAVEELLQAPTIPNYDTVVTLVVLAMFCTSRRRSCDLQKLTISDFNALEKNQDLCRKVGQCLEFSAEIMRDFSDVYCIFSCGKNSEATAIILTVDMKKAIEAIIATQEKYQYKRERLFIKLNENNEPWKVDKAIRWAKESLRLKDKANFGVRGIRHLTGTVAQLLTEKDPQIEGIFREGLSHSETVSKKYYRGNLASRIISGYGIPLLEQMGGRQGPTATVTSSQLDQGLPQAECSTAVGTSSPPQLPSTEVEKELVDDPSYEPEGENEEEDQEEEDQEEEDQEEDQEEVLPKKKLKLMEIDKLAVRRTPWTTDEDAAVVRQFYSLLKKEGRIPTSAILSAIKNEKALANRTVPQIRTRLSGIRLGSFSRADKLAQVLKTLSSPEAKKYNRK